MGQILDKETGEVEKCAIITNCHRDAVGLCQHCKSSDVHGMSISWAVYAIDVKIIQNSNIVTFIYHKNDFQKNTLLKS